MNKKPATPDKAIREFVRRGQAAQRAVEIAAMTGKIAVKRDRDGLVRCRVCSCTEREACNPPCSWAEYDLCSNCAAIANELREWLQESAHRPSMAALLREVHRPGERARHA